MAKRAAAKPTRARPTLKQQVAEQKSVISKLVRARYDAAQTTEHNRNHWSMADYYSADAALAPEVRRKMRARARYERDNNAYLAGMASTLASDLVGTGPRLQLDCGRDADAASVRRVEDAVFEWFLSIDMARKLRLAKLAKVTDGEVFAVETTNRRLRGVQLDVKLIEADQVTSPVPELYAASVDGLRFDEDGNVSEYYVLKHHPGATLSGWVGDGQWYPADNVLHWFHAFRPGQHRGVGEVVPALELFAMLRRYTLAVVTAAETAADFAAIIKTNLPADGIATAQPAWETMPLMRGMATSIPDGWDALQMKPEQPTSTYSEFTKRLINEIARCLNMPYIVAAMDSSAANYSSMRGDYLVYRKHLQCERVDLERVMLDPLVGKWLDEAALVPGLIPDGLPPMAEWTWQWTWDGFEHVDPKREADAMETRLRTHTTTLAAEYQRLGRDWRQELSQRAEEVALCKELGLFVDLSPEVNYGGDQDPNAAAAAARLAKLEREVTELQDAAEDQCGTSIGNGTTTSRS
jgi:lambda family phage portal protein